MIDPMLAYDDPSGIVIPVEECVCGEPLIWNGEEWTHENLGAAICCKTGPKPVSIRPEEQKRVHGEEAQ